MYALISTIIFITAIGFMASYRLPNKIWTPLSGFLLLAYSIWGDINGFILFLMWLAYIGIAVIFNIKSMRMKWLTKPLLRYFRNVLPVMSQTEREALEAGEVWWEGELFKGSPDWQKLLHYPQHSLSAEEKAFLDNQVETLCGMISDWDIVYQHADLPAEIWDYLKKEGFFGLVIKKEYGGKGFSALGHAAIITKIATRSNSVAVTVMVPNSLGPGELIYHYGTDEQKNYYLPRLAKGEEIPCFGLTAPEAGSDAGAMQDTGIVCKGIYEGKEVIGVRLNFDKRYITLAPRATLLGIAFKMFDPDHLIRDQERVGISLCLVPAHFPGVEKGSRHYPMGLAFLNGPLRGKDVFVPLDFIIGGPSMCGKGWRMLMEALSAGRGISIPAVAAATAKVCFRMTGIYATLRKQFGLAIGQFEGVEESMAQIAGNTYISEATRLMTLSAIDAGVRPSLVTAITKYHLSEFSKYNINHAMDIHGGKGIQLGPRNYLALIYLAIPISITVEGANILTRNLIIFGQGAIRCHPYIKAEMEAASNTDQKQGLDNFDKLFCSHLGYSISNIFRTIGYGLSGGQLIKAPIPGKLAYYYRQLTRMSTALAMLSDVAMSSLGGNLKRQENLSARLGDVLSHLYMSSAVLKYYENHNRPASDLPFVEWSLQTSLYNIQQAITEFLGNFPLRVLACFLQWAIFPWGRPYKKPRDKLNHALAKAMMQPSELRDRLSQHYFISHKEDATGRMEAAFNAQQSILPLHEKFQNVVISAKIDRRQSYEQQLLEIKNRNLLTEGEVNALLNFEKMRAEVIAVDEFEPNSLIRNPNHA